MTGKQQAKSGGGTGWPTKMLADCIEKVKVPTKIPRSSFLEEGNHPIISQEADFINGYWNDEADLVRVPEPVVVFGDHTQVLKLVDFDFVVGADGVKILKPKHFLDAGFLRFYLEANPFPSLGYARHYRHISTLGVPLPPLEEQKRIVAVLDQAFAALDRARAHAEANLADANHLKERGADRLLRRIAANSPTRLLGELAEFRNGLNFSRHSNGETVKVAGVGDFQRNFWLPIEDLKTISIEGQLGESDRLCAGDIVTVRSNGNKDLIGRVMLVGKTLEGLSFSGFVIRIRVQSADVDPEYFATS